MAIFKCKMCGAPLEVQSGQKVVKCAYCGVTQTLPRLDSDKKVHLYDRADHFRRDNDYDKALSIYEKILDEDDTDAEAYWSLVLCKYGIEYVDDPSTNKKIPTVNRMQIKSILNDEDYLKALEYANEEQKALYIAEAQAIDKIQKNILAISQKEEPFDVFICYKETDNSGRRTQDSVIAQELYYELTNVGYKVFFSRITLEDKLGTQYEPYIFAALNSAKVMVIVGTKPEYFNAVWVRNEWGRFLKLAEQNHDKKLIPAYRDMDPYDIPEELSNLQAQDMSKLGFMQDLVRGIKKITKNNETLVNQTIVNNVVNTNANLENYIKRAKISLESRDYNGARVNADKILDIDPENADAYITKLCCDAKDQKLEFLILFPQDIINNSNFINAKRFANEEQMIKLKEVERCSKIFLEHIKLMDDSRNSERRLEEIEEDYTKSKEEFEIAELAMNNLEKNKKKCKLLALFTAISFLLIIVPVIAYCCSTTNIIGFIIMIVLVVVGIIGYLACAFVLDSIGQEKFDFHDIIGIILGAVLLFPYFSDLIKEFKHNFSDEIPNDYEQKKTDFDNINSEVISLNNIITNSKETIEKLDAEKEEITNKYFEFE